MTGSRLEPRERWQAPDAGSRYAGERWSSPRKRARDAARVDALLGEHLAARPALLLDVPCGAGRLLSRLAAHGRAVGLDVSESMLAAARGGGASTLLRGDVEHLPFRDRSFDAVVCCRLLHHLGERAALERVLAELVRVSRGLVVASFWDSASLPEWKRACFPGSRSPRRVARSKAELEAAFTGAGAEVLGYRHSLRFVSRQAFCVARRRAEVGGDARPDSMRPDSMRPGTARPEAARDGARPA